MTATTAPAINRKALGLLHIYTAHTFYFCRLAGDGMKEQRRQIMTALAGKKMPIAKSGVTAIENAFHAMAGDALDGWTCLRDREIKFSKWAKEIITTA